MRLPRLRQRSRGKHQLVIRRVVRIRKAQPSTGWALLLCKLERRSRSLIERLRKALLDWLGGGNRYLLA